MSLLNLPEPDELFLPASVAKRASERTLDIPPPGDLDLRIPPTRGDHDLNPGTDDLIADMPTRRAAVLVPLVAHEQGTSVILTQRPSHMSSHPGQIAFPGGKVEDGDDGPLGAALREAEEEIGLSRELVSPVGYLDLYLTRTRFRVVPVVAMVKPGFTLSLDVNEVSDAFEVPLSFLMNEANHHQHSHELYGYERHFYAMPYEDRYIWGATAGILRNLYDRLYRQDRGK